MTETLPTTGFIRLKQLLKIIPLGESTLYRRVSEGTFPKPIKLGPRTSAWRVEDIQKFIEEAG